MARKDLRLEITPFFGFNVDSKTAIREDKSSSTNMVCIGKPGEVDANNEPVTHDPCGVSMKFVCKSCQNDDRTTFKAGKIQADETVLILDKEELLEAKDPNDATRVLRVSSHPVEQVLEKTMSSGKSYFMVPSKGSEKPYALFVKLVEAHPEKAYLCQWAYQKNPRLFRISVFDGVMSFQPLAWPEDVADKPGVPDEEVSDNDLKQAEMLTSMLEEDFDADKFRDVRRERIQALFDAAQGIPGAHIEDATGKVQKPVNDMSGALAAALAAAQAAAGGKVGAAPKAAKKAAPKKATAKA